MADPRKEFIKAAKAGICFITRYLGIPTTLTPIIFLEERKRLYCQKKLQ
jgi:hypothetical protein